MSREAAAGAAARTASLTARGVTSRKDIAVSVTLMEPGHGIVFSLPGESGPVSLPARADFVVNTLRNVVLGSGSVRLCIVEHFLAAASLWGLDDMLVSVDGMEMPLGDGSGQIWTDMFAAAGWQPRPVASTIELAEPVVVVKGDRILAAVPADRFSVSYHMDWNHPLIGKRWQHWDATQAHTEVSTARTFGSLKEHQMLGLADDVVSMTEDGFTQPLRFADEPVRHKLLDLIGDLALTGVNPVAFKARFVSIKGGHELDVELARKLAPFAKR